MNMDFVVVFVCQDNETKEIKYLNKEFKNGKGYYPQNNQEDIQELINSLGYDESDLELHNLTPIDVCAVLDIHGHILWEDKE